MSSIEVHGETDRQTETEMEILQWKISRSESDILINLFDGLDLAPCVIYTERVNGTL